jgi:hypothetical protein
MALSDDGSLLACTRRSDLVVVDLISRQRVFASRPLPYPSHVAFSPDGAALLVKSVLGPIVVLNSTTGVVADVISGDLEEGCRPAFTADGRHLLDGSWKGDLTLRKLNGEIVGRDHHPHEMISRITHDRSRKSWLVEHVRIARGPKESPTSYLTLRDWPEWGVVRRTVEMDGWVESATLSPNGQLIAYLKRWWEEPPETRRWGTFLHVLSVEDQAVIAVRGPIFHGGTGFELAWSVDGCHVGVVTKGGFSFFDVEHEARHASVPCKYPSSLAFLPDGKAVALGTWGRSGVRDLDVVMGGKASL